MTTSLKIDNIKRHVERDIDKLKIEYTLYSPPGVDPWVEVRFRDEKGNEIARVSVRRDRKSLLAYFNGAKENAERLASILSVLGAKVEVKEYGGDWRVNLYTDSITAIRRVEWLDAVRALVEELHKRGLIGKEQRDRLLTEINAGPNVVEIAGAELSVWFREKETKSGKTKWLVIVYQPGSSAAFDAAVKALKGAGFVEGVHFTAKRPEGGAKGHVYLKMPTSIWRLEELRRQGIDWAERALRRLEEIAKARGFSDLLEEYLRPAREAETVDPRGLVAEDAERGIKAVIRGVRVEWDNNRPRVVVEYEINGVVKTFYFTWGATGGRIQASVRLNDEKALVLATLLGDEAIKGKSGTVKLVTNHLFALTRLRGIGWELLRWYAGATKNDTEFYSL
ncbi:paREP2b [Pyrobaculum aerophilum str. IM2]|uniref:PaREP2b n=2 Tax=Pyrobaculum aerophilum TaxID=13773 RepID=Q8ZWN8_PYRAE|nr:paREP2b [Pyrobaculum aerophilum str. IM2]HII46010.1 PaRep2b protein [Pyrobaculum aerophilum]